MKYFNMNLITHKVISLFHAWLLKYFSLMVSLCWDEFKGKIYFVGPTFHYCIFMASPLHYSLCWFIARKIYRIFGSRKKGKTM